MKTIKSELKVASGQYLMFFTGLIGPITMATREDAMKNSFSRKIGSYLFILLFSVTLVLSVSVSKVMGAVYDDFIGDYIDPTLWNIHDDGNIFSQSLGFLNADGPPNLTHANLRSEYKFSGDVEFVLDYRDFQSTATIFTENCAQIWLQVELEGGSDNFIYIFRGLCQGGHTFASNGMINGSWLDGVWSSASSESGLLKMSRTGSTITTYYNEGTGWVAHGTFTGVFTGDVIVQIAVYTGDNGTFHVASDCLQYGPDPSVFSDELAVDFAANGLWHYSGSSWMVFGIMTAQRGLILQPGILKMTW